MNKGIRRLEKYLHLRVKIWSDLARLGESKLVRTSMIWMFIVPVVAKVIEPIDQIEISLGGKALMFNAALPFSWTILYLAALMFGVGSLLYSRWRLRFVHEYPTYDEFYRLGRGSRTLIDALLVETEDEKAYRSADPEHELLSRKAVLYGFSSEFIEVDELRSQDDATEEYLVGILNQGEVKESSLPTAFLYIRSFCETLYPIRRAIVSAFYSIGMLSLFVILARNTAYVFAAAF